jgi:hypothetical protein
MLSNWGLVYLVVGINLATIEITLERYRSAERQGVGPMPPFNPHCHEADFIITLCDQILQFIDPAKHELETVPANVKALRDRIRAARQPHIAGTLDCLSLANDFRKIRNDFHTVLETRFFYYLSPGLVGFWGNPELFGGLATTKFKESRDDIEHAGNCLALGEGTACVLHLVRAMEVIVRLLGKKLKVTINPKDTWGTILNNMDSGIEALPEKNDRQKRKKSQWSECRANLWHVKQAWRDNSMHGKRAYSPAEARQILDRVSEFCCHLATL